VNLKKVIGPIDPSVDPQFRRWSPKVWIAILALHVIALAAFVPYCFTMEGLLAFLIMVPVTACLGITLCYHRLLTHRSFKTPKWFEYVLATIGTLNWQGGPIHWVGVHRIHHKESDQIADPHSPRHGFLWSHMTWTMLTDSETLHAYEAAGDLMRDKILVLIDRYFFVPQFALTIVTCAVAYWYGETYAAHQDGLRSALSVLVWGTALRTVVVYHGTWFVNSAAHTWGYRNFETTDTSRNTWWVALLSFGEGWHNNHHAFQRSAAHGLRWFEIDPTYYLIKVLSWVGLARDVVRPDAQQQQQLRDRRALQAAAKKAAEAAEAAGKAAARLGNNNVASDPA